MQKLEVLSEEQEALISIVRDEWLDRILKCDTELNREQATKGIEFIYEFCKINKPKIIFTCSPMEAQLTAYYLGLVLNEIEIIFKTEAKQQGANIWANIWANTRANIWANIGDNIGDNIRDNIRANIRANIWANIWANTRANIWANIGDNIGDNKIKYEPFSSYGNIGDYGWVAFYDYFTRIGVLNNKDFNSFKSLIGAGIYDMIQLKGFCIVCELPNKITRDEAGRLHNTNQSAISWSDGYEQYYIHGRAVKKELFDRCIAGKVTKNDFIKEGNEENKAAIYEILGQEKMLQLLDAKEIDRGTFVHTCGDLEEVILYKTTERLPELNNQPLAWVRFVCPSTGTNYLIDVEPRHTDARKAAVSTSPIIETVEDYSWDERA